MSRTKQQKRKNRHKVQSNKKPKDKNLSNNESSKDKQGDSQSLENVGYPDISKANTKMIVIVSLVCILAILMLSVLFPASQKEEPDATTEAATENEITANKDAKTGFTSIENKTYYYPDDVNMFTGWYKIDDATYYFDEDGVMVTGWYILNGHQYYFDENGVMQTNQWIDSKYVGEEGYILKNTVTPDGNYVDANGYADTTITSILVPTKYKAPSSPGRNYTTVVDCGLLLEKIYKGQCVSPVASDKFLDLLLQQTHTNKIPAGLPEEQNVPTKPEIQMRFSTMPPLYIPQMAYISSV